MKHIPDQIREALIATGLPWDIVVGGQHFKIVLNGRLVGVVGRNGNRAHNNYHTTRNVIAQIKRAARGVTVSKHAQAS